MVDGQYTNFWPIRSSSVAYHLSSDLSFFLLLRPPEIEIFSLSNSSVVVAYKEKIELYRIFPFLSNKNITNLSLLFNRSAFTNLVNDDGVGEWSCFFVRTL